MQQYLSAHYTFTMHQPQFVAGVVRAYPTVHAIVASGTAECDQKIRWLHADTARTREAIVTGDHGLGIAAAIGWNPNLARLASGGVAKAAHAATP